MSIDLVKQKELSDLDYVVQIQDRNEKITERFFHAAWKYFKDSYKSVFSREDLMDDIFQQSFVKLWTEIETKKIFVLEEDGRLYRYDRHGDIRILTCSLKTFLMDIAKNDYRTWLRNEHLALEADFESFAHLTDVVSSVGMEESAETLQEQIVNTCVLELPPRCKEILTMFYYKGMSLDEIIKARGEKNISKNGLKTGKYKCMETLKAKVKESFRQYKLKY